MGQPSQGSANSTPESTASRPPRRGRSRFSAQDVAKRKTHGLIGQLTVLFLQPHLFFYTFPKSRQWLLLAIFALGLVGFASIQRAKTSSSVTPSSDASLPSDGGFSTDFGTSDPTFSDGGAVSGDPFEVPIPSDGFVDEGTSVGGAEDINNNVSIAITGATWIVLTWVIQSTLLLIVPLANGYAPSFGKNLQIAVWASCPLIVMLIIQLLYHGAGGKGESIGLTALVRQWDGFSTYGLEVQLSIYSALAQTTLFSVWNLWLLFVGARETLKGKFLPSLLVVCAWALIAVIVPVAMGRVIMPMPV